MCSWSTKLVPVTWYGIIEVLNHTWYKIRRNSWRFCTVLHAFNKKLNRSWYVRIVTIGGLLLLYAVTLLHFYGVVASSDAQRLPKDFEPFFAIDTRTKLGGQERSTHCEGPDGRTTTGWAFRVAFAVFSSRAWDGLYLSLGLLWSVLCPGYLDGAIGVARSQLALLLLAMFGLVVAPVIAATIFKACFYNELRSRLCRNRRSKVR